MLKDLLKIYEYREMLRNSVRKELRSRYKGSVLGFMWTFINPLLMLIVYSIIFSRVMKVVVPGCSYTLFLFVGLIPWTYFSTALQQSTTIIVANSNLIKKVYFPRLILPLTVTLTGLINMLITFIIVFAAVVLSRMPVTLLYFYLPLVAIIQTLLVFAFSMIFAAVTVYLRDLEHIMSVAIMAWFYLTPIVYTAEYIPQDIFNLFKMNPMMVLVDSYRDIFLFARIPDFTALTYVLMLAVILLFIGYALYNKLQRRFAEEI